MVELKVAIEEKSFGWQCRIWENGKEKGTDMKDRKNEEKLWELNVNLKIVDCFN